MSLTRGGGHLLSHTLLLLLQLCVALKVAPVACLVAPHRPAGALLLLLRGAAAVPALLLRGAVLQQR